MIFLPVTAKLSILSLICKKAGELNHKKQKKTGAGEAAPVHYPNQKSIDGVFVFSDSSSEITEGCTVIVERLTMESLGFEKVGDSYCSRFIV